MSTKLAVYDTAWQDFGQSWITPIYRVARAVIAGRLDRERDVALGWGEKTKNKIKKENHKICINPDGNVEDSSAPARSRNREIRNPEPLLIRPKAEVPPIKLWGFPPILSPRNHTSSTFGFQHPPHRHHFRPPNLDKRRLLARVRPLRGPRPTVG